MTVMTPVVRERATRRTFTLNGSHSPLVVDEWTPAAPAADVPPILLIHGWGGTGSYWEGTAEALAQTARVIVPDLPGTGRSQPVRSARSMFDQVDALVQVLDEFELKRVQVVGHSMGGAMALLLADMRPDAIERVVLTSLTFFRTLAQERVYRSVMKVFRLSMRFRPAWLADVPGVAQMMARHYFYRVPADRALLRQGLLDYLQLDAATATRCADDATTPAIPAAGLRVRVPVLLVACEEDQMMPPENVDYTATIIPDCTVVRMAECGHLPMVEKPDEYLAILRDFLRLGRS
jgi:pimeloyl-ACP methyl ester carboxylesterase